MNTKKPHLSPKDSLDDREQALAQKHQRQLHSMTQEALLSRQKNWFKPAMATAFSIMLVTTLVLINTSDNPGEQVDPDLPVWVTDTNVPLNLIEHLEFYDWLAQQPENQQARYQEYDDEKPTTLAANDDYQYCLSQRLTTRDFTKRIFGTTAYFGTVQR